MPECLAYALRRAALTLIAGAVIAAIALVVLSAARPADPRPLIVEVLP